ncbi:pyridoxamine 5-phosphate oxidase [Methanoculleus sp. YWC-01]|uniref:Pyridoxamine 5-phosphate oxidase n=1 Tax=Methanoculleus nereidis TaxID=2735141 RepID=A0ABU3Z425_9EURY|nr:pyridoxamine 5'-phosphate oxidase family protein [Methanoculleus sp. YWC-01]MCK9297459.1 pyridoxamine 5'-phosphate oxidase family protein [Methanoculleus sp.]MDV4343543.1 pyridoxamine 5-phosphate oxidase [Methanoculleus sp. YWC-01]
MVALSGEIKEIFTKTKVMPMATASKSGVPNVAPMASIQLVADDTVWIMDNYMVKTLDNLKENPVVALYFYDQDTKRCFQVKGDTEIKTSGPDYEKFRDQVRTKGHQYPAKSLIVIKITDVFECTPGKEAGKKVL